MGLTRFRAHQLYDFDYKESVRAATTGTVTLSGGAPSTVDTVNLAVGDRVLVWQQSTASQNGIYRVSVVGSGSNGTWVRAIDADASEKVTTGMTTRVEEGSANINKLFRLVTLKPITLGSTNLTFEVDTVAAGAGGSNGQVQFNTSGTLAGTSGLTWDGSRLNANLLKSTQSSGSEGGQLDLAAPASSTSIDTGVSFDLYQNQLRIFETGGTNRGVYIDISALAAGVSTDLATTITNGNSNVKAIANANVTISSAGNANILTVTGTGTVVAGTVDSTGIITAPRFTSNIATGTAPFTVTSTTQVANLNVANAGYAVNAGTVTTAAQPNITSVGTLSSLGVSGAVTASTLVSNVSTGTAPFTVTSTTQVANLNVANAGYAVNAGTVTAAAQPNITSLGTLSSLAVSGQVQATYFTSNIATGTAPFVVSSTTQVANLNVATAGYAAQSEIANTVTVAAQPNITSLGNLTTANVANLNISTKITFSDSSVQTSAGASTGKAIAMAIVFG